MPDPNDENALQNPAMGKKMMYMTPLTQCLLSVKLTQTFEKLVLIFPNTQTGICDMYDDSSKLLKNIITSLED